MEQLKEIEVGIKTFATDRLVYVAGDGVHGNKCLGSSKHRAKVDRMMCCREAEQLGGVAERRRGRVAPRTKHQSHASFQWPSVSYS